MGAECENAYAVETHASSHRRGGPFTLTFRAEPGAILEVFDLIGGRTRTRTLDPLIKSHWVPPSAYFDAPRRISVRYWFEAAIRCELNRCTAIIFTQFHLPMLTLRFPGRLRSIPWRRKN